MEEENPVENEPREEPQRGEWLRRLAYLGVGTVFLTQEAASRLLRELKLPREARDLLLKEIEKNKGELLRAVQEVLREFLNNLPLQRILEERLRETRIEELLRSLLQGLELEIRAKLKLHYDEPPPSGGREPSSNP